MEQRTNFDFSENILSISESDNATVYTFKKPDTVYGRVVWICSNGITAVTGDFGNWVFCREFHPHHEGYIPRGYADEKLEMYSVQESHKYDSDKTFKRIQEFKDSYNERYDREMTEDAAEWVGELEEYVDDQFEYEHIVYRKAPCDVEYDELPIGKIRHYWLECIYDAFNCMCDQMPKND